MKKRITCLLLTGLLILTAAAGCGGGSSDNNTSNNNNASNTNTQSNTGNETPTTPTTPTTPIDEAAVATLYEALDPNTEAEVTLMMWSGDDKYHTDIGHKDWKPEDINGQNVGAIYASAKAFNEVYPNIKINLTTNWNWDVSWAQNQENFKNEYGRYPDIIAASSLATGIELGMIADLSVFKDDPVYQSFNPAIMELMNFYGFQAGLPQFLMPWYIPVNKSLANDNNIDVPPVNWTIDQLTDFVSQADNSSFYGIGNFDSARVVTLGTKDVIAQLINRKEGEPYVRLNSDAVKNILGYFPKWATYTINDQYEQGRLSDEFISGNGGWDLGFWGKGITLASFTDSWMMGDIVYGSLPDNNGTDPSKEAHWLAIPFEFDLYPYPSTEYVPNTVGVTLNPWVIRNFAMDTGGEYNDESMFKLKVAYEFLKFFTGDTRAWEARANQYFKDGNGNVRPAMNDSFPFTTGAEFDHQMEYWFMAENHAPLKDAAKYPGFHEILNIWKNGQIWDVGSDCYAGQYDKDGTATNVLDEWQNQWNPDVVGARRSDPNWLDQVKARLGDWDQQSNDRFEQAYGRVKSALKNYYGFTDDQFN